MNSVIVKGQKINDRYEIVKSIGEGGMANVYLAMDTILDRKVAIKVLRGDLANDDKFIRRFQREALSASSLSHPNIVEMYDVGEDGGNYYIVMEYVEGRTLKQLLKKRGTLTISEVVDIMLQLTDGISHAHGSYIIHRDLKPQNIMIEENGAIKITDFGIAMAMNASQLTQTNSVMGSVHYLPPEQASGKGSTIKSDIYSMGILFYELLTGTLPFKGENAVEIALKHMKDTLPSVKKDNPNIPTSIENIILKATAKNPKNRYNDVKEMHEDLVIALNPDVINQEKYTYKYPEHEPTEQTTNITTKKETKIKKGEEGSKTDEIIKEIPKQSDKKTSIIIWILSITVFLAIIISAGLFVKSLFSTVPTIKVPNVSGLTVIEAEKVLTDLGFVVENNVIKEPNENITEGKIIRTEPMAERNRKKGTSITLYVSSGKDTYEIENYIGKNNFEIKAKLEAIGLKVTVEKKEIEITDDLDPLLIIEQSVEAGTKVEKNSSIILYVPDAYDKYPDFVSEGWSADEIQAFCDKYTITLIIKEEITESYPEGTVIYQSRPAKSKIMSNVTLNITITKKASEIINPGGPETPDPDDQEETETP